MSNSKNQPELPVPNLASCGGDTARCPASAFLPLIRDMTAQLVSALQTNPEAQATVVKALNEVESALTALDTSVKDLKGEVGTLKVQESGVMKTLRFLFENVGATMKYLFHSGTGPELLRMVIPLIVGAVLGSGLLSGNGLFIDILKTIFGGAP